MRCAYMHKEYIRKVDRASFSATEIRLAHAYAVGEGRGWRRMLSTRDCGLPFSRIPAGKRYVAPSSLRSSRMDWGAAAMLSGSLVFVSHHPIPTVKNVATPTIP